MRKAIVLAAFLTFSIFANAGFLTVICSNPEEPDFDATHKWGFVYDDQLVWLIESYDHLGTDSVYVDGVTEDDPDLTMTKQVTNSNGHIWTAYSLTIDGDATFVSASSDLLPDVDLTANQVIFSGGTVDPDEILNMSVVINVPTIGDFGFCLHQLAIPEPASMVLLGIGSLLIGRRRK